ncbi:MAG: hypothetical protein R6V67_12500 [Spirochaetia bacterium]
MRKRVFFTLIVLVFFGATTAVHSLGLGLSFGGRGDFGPGYGSNAMLSLKLDSQDFILGLGASGDGDNFGLAATADWWLVNENLTGMLNYYVGPGGYLGISTGHIDAGLRIPVGLNIYPIDPLELFLEVAPAMGIDSDFNFPTFGWQTALGFRFWF